MEKYGIEPRQKAARRYSDEEILGELRKAAERYLLSGDSEASGMQ